MTATRTEITLPPPRGQKKIERHWTKTITHVAAHVTSGRDYAGEWLTSGARVEMEPGALIAVQDGDGIGAVIYVLVPNAICGDPAGLPIRQPEWWTITADASKQWAGQCAVDVRKWLRLPPGERLALARGQKRARREAQLSAVTDDSQTKYNNAPGPDRTRDAAWWRAYYQRQLAAYDQADDQAHDPRAKALAQILRLMADHGLTIGDLAGGGAR